LYISHVVITPRGAAEHDSLAGDADTAEPEESLHRGQKKAALAANSCANMVAEATTGTSSSGVDAYG
jgi:hypothetical protein